MVNRTWWSYTAGDKMGFARGDCVGGSSTHLATVKLEKFSSPLGSQPGLFRLIRFTLSSFSSFELVFESNRDRKSHALIQSEGHHPTRQCVCTRSESAARGHPPASKYTSRSHRPCKVERHLGCPCAQSGRIPTRPHGMEAASWCPTQHPPPAQPGPLPTCAA